MRIHALCRTVRLRCLGAALIAMLPCSLVRGSSVATMDMPEIADYAGQVIVGEVETVRSYWAENPHRIESEITFKNVDYLKGRLADSTDHFILIVPGGKVGTMEMRVSCAPIFDRGGRYVLFLLPTYKTFPTVGLGQGSFQLLRDAHGVERIHQYGSHPVSGFSADGYVRLAGRPASEINEHLVDSRGARLAAAEVGPRSAGAAENAAMSFADFTAYLRPILEKSRDHGLTEAAGKPAPVEKTATTLKVAPGDTGSTTAASVVGTDDVHASAVTTPTIRGIDAVRESLDKPRSREVKRSDTKTGGAQ